MPLSLSGSTSVGIHEFGVSLGSSQGLEAPSYSSHGYVRGHPALDKLRIVVSPHLSP